LGIYALLYSFMYTSCVHDPCSLFFRPAFRAILSSLCFLDCSFSATSRIYNSFLVSRPLTPPMLTSVASPSCRRAVWSLRVSTGLILVPFSRSAAQRAAPTWLVTARQLGPSRPILYDVQVKMIETTGTRPRTMEMVPNLGVSSSQRTRSACLRSVCSSSLGNGGVSLLLVVSLELEVSSVVARSGLVSCTSQSSARIIQVEGMYH
jgi:hypothetical protein